MKKPWIIPVIMVSAIIMTLIGADKISSTVKIDQGDIKFSHKLHVQDNELECGTCHESTAISDRAEDINLPGMDNCGNCHDVEDDEQCGTCHRNADEPGGFLKSSRELVFNHKLHIENKTECNVCHSGIEKQTADDPQVLPGMRICFGCHDGLRVSNDCALCHSSGMTLAEIHPEQWSHQHGERAASDRTWCGQCHTGQDFCLGCHRGDNTLGGIHDLNYMYTHGLDAKSKASDCGQCHDNQAFCVACHESGRRMPLAHSTLSWGSDHGKYAREDVENCASCHENDDPTCARAGCHNDFDGIRGTDTRIHSADAPQFDMGGPWHNDDGYYCYQCHVKVTKGDRFCGYCHN